MKIVTTRKEHDCFTCGLPIKKGEKAKIWLSKYLHHDSFTETYFESHYFHMNCKITTPEEWTPPKLPMQRQKRTRRKRAIREVPNPETCQHQLYETMEVYRDGEIKKMCMNCGATVQ